jgi:hypothetical protein
VQIKTVRAYLGPKWPAVAASYPGPQQTGHPGRHADAAAMEEVEASAVADRDAVVCGSGLSDPISAQNNPPIVSLLYILVCSRPGTLTEKRGGHPGPGGTAPRG